MFFNLASMAEQFRLGKIYSPHLPGSAGSDNGRVSSRDS